MTIRLNLSLEQPTTQKSQSQITVAEQGVDVARSPIQSPMERQLNTAAVNAGLQFGVATQTVETEQTDAEHECGPDCLGPDFIQRMEKALAGPRYGLPQGLGAKGIGEFLNKVAAGDPETVALALELGKKHESEKEGNEPDAQRSPVVDSGRPTVFSTKKRGRKV